MEHKIVVQPHFSFFTVNLLKVFHFQLKVI